MDELVRALVVAFGPSVFWLGYLVHVSRVRHQDLGLLVAFFAGVVAGPVALALFEGLIHVPFYADLEHIDRVRDEVVRFAYCVFGIGPVEEGAKLLAVAAVFYRRRELTTPVDGLLFASAAGLGFASVENWYFMAEAGEVVWSRALTLPFNHMLFSSFSGVALSWATLRPGAGNIPSVLVAFALAVVYHGTYDYILLSPVVPDLLVLPLVVALWAWLSLAVRRLAREAQA